MKQESESRPALRPMLSFTDTFQSSQNEKEERFHLDRLLARGIIQNNSSIIVEQHHETLPTVGEDFDLEQECNKILFQFRLKYDKVRTEVLTLEGKIAQEKQECQRLQEEQEMLAGSKRDAERTYKAIEDELTNQTYLVQQTLLSLDCRLAMQDRLKQDIIYYKKKIFDANMALLKKQSDLKLRNSHSMRQKKLSVRCKNLLTSVEKTLTKNHLERSFRIEDAKEVLSTKQEYLLRQREREWGLERSMLAALSEKLPEERELIKVLHTNRFLKKILHCKMQALMKKYEQVNNSFSQIRSNSSVRTAEDFVNRYINKNVIYGQLSDSISKLEPRIGVLQTEKAQLLAQGAALRAKGEEIAELFKHSEESQLDRMMQQLRTLNQRIQKINKYRNSWTNWALSVVAMFRAVPRSEIRSKYEYLGTLLGDTFRMLLKYLQQEQEKEASISEQALGKQLAKGNLKLNDLIVRNVRVKTLGNEHSHRQQDEVEYDLISQKDYLHHARRAVKKHRLARNITITSKT